MTEFLTPENNTEAVDTPMEKLIDLNTASKTQLMSLPAIGRVLSQRIMDARPITSLEALAAVPGISNSVLDKIQPFITFDEPGEVPEEPDAVHPTRMAAESLDALEALLDETPAPSEDSTDEVQPLPIEESSTEPPTEELSAPPPIEEAQPVPINTEEEQSASSAEEVTLVEEEPPTGEEPPASPIEEEPLTSKEPTALPPASAPRGISRTQAVWMVFGSALISMLLAIIFTLAVLSGINGGLRYAANTDMRRTARELGTLQNQIDALGNDVDGLRTRLDSLDTLSGRVTDLENDAADFHKSISALDEGLGQMQTTIDETQTSLDDLATQVETVNEQQTTFSAFFESLRDTLIEYFGPSTPATPESQNSPMEGTATPTTTATPTPQASPTPQATP